MGNGRVFENTCHANRPLSAVGSSSMFRHFDRSLRAGTFLGLLALTTACGSSTATSTAPSSLSRCGVTLNGGGTVPASGGSVTINVTAARECEWSAATEASWLSIKAGARGQGNGSVELAAAANPDPAVRRGSVVLNEQRLELTQAAGECSFTLGERSAAMPRTGGLGHVDLRASSSLCTWTAEADSAWIGIKGQPNGRGSAQIQFEVSATTGPGRRGVIRVAGQEFEVVQSEGCTYTLSPSSQEVGGAGGSGAVTVATGPGCPWTAQSGVGWLTLSGDRGTGPGSISFEVAATNVARTGSATIAGRTFTVTQSVSPAPTPAPAPTPTPAPVPTPSPAPTCSYAVEPRSVSVAAGGERIAINVTAGSSCAWTVSSGAEWITPRGSGGSGNGAAEFDVAAASGPARSGSVVVAGQTVTVSQAAGCSFSVSPEEASVGALGGTVKTTVTAPGGCGWTATSEANWIQVVSGASGSGTADVTLLVLANLGAARSGAVTIANRTYTIEQEAILASTCRIRLDPDELKISARGRIERIEVSAPRDCTWTAESNVSWIRVLWGRQGSGDGEVVLGIDDNEGRKREGKVTIGDETLDVEQREERDD